jgi:hypothetical protein
LKLLCSVLKDISLSLVSELIVTTKRRKIEFNLGKKKEGGTMPNKYIFELIFYTFYAVIGVSITGWNQWAIFIGLVYFFLVGRIIYKAIFHKDNDEF